jgi:predicted GIY-YIG superfamily endonuclease
MPYYVYILSNSTGTKLRIGVSFDLKSTVDAVRDSHPASITEAVSNLVFYEPHEDEEEARTKAESLRGLSWLHQTQYINFDNPEWLDLYYDL